MAKRRASIQTIRTQHKRAKLEWEIAQYNQATSLMESVSNIVKDTESKDWTQIGGAASDDRVLSLQDHQTLQKQAFKMWKQNPVIRNVIRTLVAFVYGQGAGFQTTPEKQNGKEPDTILHDKIHDLWQKWYAANNGQRKFREIITRGARDGEDFLWWFDQEESITFRFIDPDKIASPDTNIPYGIETDRKDIETPLFYHYTVDGELKERIPADRVFHIKIGVDSNVLRGESMLRPVLKYALQYDSWLQDRIILNKVRTAVALIRKMVATPAQRLSIVDASRASSTESKQKMLKPGTIIDAPPGVEYEMLGGKIQASDVSEDGRRILLMIAVGAGYAEYMVTGDASNANYASTMVAESPAVRTFQDWQKFFGDWYEKIFKRVMLWHIKAGLLEEAARKEIETVQTEFPPLLHRDFLKETQAIGMQRDRDIISKQSARGLLGLSHEEEENRLKAERETEDNEDPDAELDKAREGLLGTLKEELEELKRLKKLVVPIKQ